MPHSSAQAETCFAIGGCPSASDGNANFEKTEHDGSTEEHDNALVSFAVGAATASWHMESDPHDFYQEMQEIASGRSGPGY